MHNKRHVLILPSWYPENANDLNGSFFREQAQALHKSGLKVGVLAIKMRSLRTLFKRQNSTSLTYYKDEGIVTLRKGFFNWIPRISSGSAWLFTQAGLTAFKEYIAINGKPDVIHVHSVRYSGMLALAIYEKYQIPYCMTEHTTAYAMQLFNRNELLHIEQVAQRSAYNIAVSESFQSLLSHQLPSSRWCYIPNMLPAQFSNLQLDAPKEDNFIFCNVSILKKKKGIHTLIKAFAEGFRDVDNTKLHIIGDGPERDNLNKLVVELGLEQKVVFLGAIRRNEIVDSFKQINSYVLSSQYETFGISLIEALALGLPAVATRCGGPESILKEGFNGYFCDVDDVSSMANAMLKLYHNRDKFHAEKIADDCHVRFGEATIVSQLTDIYNEIIEKSHV